jgi:Zn-dependent protease
LQSLDFTQLIPWFAILLVSLSVHEAAHAWTADRLGDPTARLLGRVTLNPLAHIDWIGTVLFPLIAIMTGFPVLGWAKPVPVNMYNLRAPRRDFAIVALAGPVSNILLGVLAGIAFMGFTASGASAADLAAVWLTRAVMLNFLLAIFNMLPVPPLDGGNVLAGLLPEAGARVIDAVRPYGFLLLYVLLFTGVLGAIVRPINLFVIRWLLL